MAEVNLGRIGFVNKGSWISAANYKTNDVVKYGGSTYAAKRPNSGVTPPTNGTDTDDWFYFVNNSDYVDKTSDQDIIGIKNFTESPTVPTPTNDYQVATKKYVDDTNNINTLADKQTLVDTDNFAIQEVGGDFKKVSYKNLLGNISITTTATLNGTTNNTIAMTDIVTSLKLEVGDVIRIEYSGYDKLHTVESITNDNSIIVNYEHAGNRGNGSLKLPDVTEDVTATRIAKWYNAPLGMGQAIVNVTSFRSKDTNFFLSGNRSTAVSYGTVNNNSGVSNLITVTIDGINNITVNSAPDGLGKQNGVWFTVPMGSTYKVTSTLNMLMWSEVR